MEVVPAAINPTARLTSTRRDQDRCHRAVHIGEVHGGRPAGGDQQRDGGDGAGSVAPERPRPVRGGDHQDGGGRHQGHAGGERRVAEHELQVLGDDETVAEAEEILHGDDAAADRERGIRKQRTSIRGSVVRSSQTQKSPSAAAPPISPASTRGSDHPRSGPSMRANTKPAGNKIDRTTPMESILTSASGGRVRNGYRHGHERRRRNRHVHQKQRTPPKATEQSAGEQGATTAPADAVAAHTPIARRNPASV